MKRAAFMLLFHVYLERIKQESGLDSLFVLGEKKKHICGGRKDQRKENT